MARSKSIPGSKTSRTTKKEQAAGTDAISPNVNGTAGATSVEAASEQPKSTTEANVMPASKSAPEMRKMEVVKNDSRKNLVPINLEDEIRQRAFELYQQRGGSGSGTEAADWLAAEREVRQRYRQHSA